MEIPAIRQAIRAQPFRPFLMRLADGWSTPVPHPEIMAIAGRNVLVTSPQQDESYSVIDSLLIVSLDFAAMAASSGGNGEQK
jgi:hypothetical protein